jgi:hypothetical protein
MPVRTFSSIAERLEKVHADSIRLLVEHHKIPVRIIIATQIPATPEITEGTLPLREDNLVTDLFNAAAFSTPEIIKAVLSHLIGHIDKGYRPLFFINTGVAVALATDDPSQEGARIVDVDTLPDTDKTNCVFTEVIFYTQNSTIPSPPVCHAFALLTPFSPSHPERCDLDKIRRMYVEDPQYPALPLFRHLLYPFDLPPIDPAEGPDVIISAFPTLTPLTAIPGVNHDE